MPHKCSLVGALAALAAGTLLALSVSTGSVAGQTAHAAETVRQGLLAELKHIDKRLSKLINDLRSGSLDTGGQTIDRIAEIEKAKREMVSAFFEQPVYGLKFSFVFLQLDCLDGSLS